MLSSCAALLVLAGTGWMGAELLRKTDTGLGSLELLAYGVPLGVVLSSLAILVLAGPFGLSAVLVWIVAVASVVVAAASRGRPAWRRSEGRGFSLLAQVVFAVFAVRWMLLFGSTLTLDAGGLLAGHP